MVNKVLVRLKKPEISKKNILPAVLTIAGSDNSGGAGIEADLKTLSAHKVYGLTCITALTAQNTQSVKSFEKTPEHLIRKILELNFNDFLKGHDEPPLKAIKTGMLTKEAVLVIRDYMPLIKQNGIKLIVDPVMISTSGSILFDKEGMRLCVDTVIKESFLVTPNYVEALALQEILSDDEVKSPSIESLDEFINFVINLQKGLGCENILVKGGHLPWDTKLDRPFQGTNFDAYDSNISIIDILYESKTDTVTLFESSYLNTKDSHGTGCTLASSIAANLAKGLSLQDALPLSINYIHKGMLSLGKKLGHGNGPLNHTTEPEERKSAVIKSDTNRILSQITNNHESLLDFFKNHSKIKENWKTYTEHTFIKLLAENRLPFDKFVYFLKQDYFYLINYAQVHALAASVAPSYHQTHAQATIIGEIVTEIERHKEKLCEKYNIDYERDMDLDIDLNPGIACLNYCNYLLDVARNEDFLGIKVALAPCLHGYAEACVVGHKLRKSIGSDLGSLQNQDESDVYTSWLSDYSSDWYMKAHHEGKNALQDLFLATQLSQERLDELVDIFNKVTILEIEFWNEVLNK